jgi:hypothetical protein
MNKIVLNNQVYTKTLVHEFKVDVDLDVGIYAGSDIYDWEQSDQGKWVMANSVKTPEVVTKEDIMSWCWRCRIFAYLTDANLTFFNLKWGNK